MLFKLSNLNSNLALILGYLNPALNNSALLFIEIPPKNRTNGANMHPYKLGQQRVYHWAKRKKCLPGTKQAILSRQESLAAMLVSLHGTAATWHLQTKLTLYKFRCKISFKLSESHEKLHSLKKLGDSQLSLRRTPLGPALRLVSVLERCSSYRESYKGKDQL